MLLGFAREEGFIHITKVDRIDRNIIDVLQIVDKLAQKNAGLVFYVLGELDIKSDVGRVIYITISAFAEMERKRILQRCNEGWERSLEEGMLLKGFLISSFNNAFNSLLNKGRTSIRSVKS